MRWDSIVAYGLALALAPLLTGVINRTKAVFAGRHGQPLLQSYRDIAKLLRKGSVYSRTTTWVFRAGPVVSLAATVTALACVPLGGIPALLAFDGDFLLVVYLLGAMRFFTVVAALDTGSSFEGMGASREVQFAALCEPALLLGLVALARATGELSLSSAMAGAPAALVSGSGSVIALLLLAWMAVFLAENSRIPVDDPNTHLELTMIHEVMVLDHGGPDLAFILYASTLKLWILGAFLVGLLAPTPTGNLPLDAAAGVALLAVLAAVVGAIESTMARLSLLKVPHLLLAASACAVMANFLVTR